MSKENPQRCYYEIGPIRPPSEGKDCSLLIRATKNCPWNKCQFCSIYKDQKFEYRKLEDIKEDIDVVKYLSEQMKATSWKMGQGGQITDNVVLAVIEANADNFPDSLDPPERANRVNCQVNVANWLASGARTVFLQDANTLIMRPPELIALIEYLKTAFPTIERVTSYARAKTAAQRTPDELKRIHEAGLSRIHIGLESGSDEVLAEMQKGVTAEEHIKGGKKIVESGISLSEYIMPGLGGKKWSTVHAKESARVLNEINPDFIRIRTLMVARGMPLHQKINSGEFQVMSEDEMVDEIRLFVENLDCTAYVASDQMANLLMEVEGQLPKHKQRMLDYIDRYRSLPLDKRLRFRLHRRMQSYLAIYGQLPPNIDSLIQEALQSIKENRPDAESKVDQAITALKGGFL